MFKRCRCLMLPTNQKAPLILGKTKVLFFNKNESSFRSIQDAVYQHLYILSDNEIKEGDWYYDPEENVIEQLHNDELPMSYDKKVIATTNFSLHYKDDEPWNLPSPSQSFITKYVEEYNKGNKIEEVMVEYSDFTQCKGKMEWYTDEQRQDDNGIDSYYQCVICGDIRKNVVGNMNNIRTCGKHTEGTLKVNSKDNTITIRKIKDSWTREEVIALCFRSYNLRTEDKEVRSTKSFNEWINKNL